MIENLNVCDNLADHMVGSVYVKFLDEDAAAKAMQSLQVRTQGLGLRVQECLGALNPKEWSL